MKEILTQAFKIVIHVITKQKPRIPRGNGEGSIGVLSSNVRVGHYRVYRFDDSVEEVSTPVKEVKHDP